MPGQAQGIQQVMPGMQRQGPQAGTPQAMVGPLSQMHMQQLMQLMMNPRPDGPPLYAVISAISEQQKKAQAQAAMQRQGAMAQGQQAAQQPPVAQEVMAQAQQMQQPQQEPVMAAYGGEMRGYADGGEVAFQSGAGPLGLPQENPEEDLSDDSSLSLRERNIRAEKRRALSRQQGVGRSFAERFPDPAQSATDTGDELARMLGRAPAPVPMAMRDTRGVTPDTVAAARTLGAGQSQQRPPAAPAAATAAPMPGITAALSPDEQRRFEERKAALEGRRNLPPELLEGRTGIEALMQKNLAEQRAEAKTFGEEARAARDAAMAKAQRGILDDPQALLALAGSIDTRRGKGLGSLARGAAGIMGGKEAAAEAARKEYTTAQQTERMLQANIRQGNMLEAQRVQALREGDYNRANQIDDAINQNAAERSKLERSIQDKAFDQGAKQRELAVLEGGLKLRQDEAKRGPVPSMQDQMAKNAIDDWLKKNPGKSYSDAVEWWRGAGKGIEGRERLGNLKLAAETLSKQLENPLLLKADKDSKSADLNRVQAEILSLLGMSSTGSQAPMYAKNPKTGERIMSTDGGQTWKSAQ
jgi:hypothetical protein